jgi:hypothetical protein
MMAPATSKDTTEEVTIPQVARAVTAEPECTAVSATGPGMTETEQGLQ